MNARRPPPAWRLPEGVNPPLWEYLNTPRLAAEEDAYFAGHPLFEADARALDERLRTPGRLIDLGCGAGRHAARFASRGFEVVADTEIDTLPQGAFDLVAAFDVFEHIAPHSSVDFLRSLARRLRADGRILLRYPNADSWLGNAFQYGDPTHVNAIGTLKLDFYAAQAGLEVVAYRGARRRGFRASPIHGLHRITAGAYSSVAGTLRRAIHFPDVRVVLSTSNVVAVLRRV